MATKRIKTIPRNPNPLFKKWLREWIDEAEKKNRKISKTYEKALESLNKYPLNLYSGQDCSVLMNVGPKICQMLDERLEEHLKGRLDLFQHRSYKDKILEVKRREESQWTDLIKSVEAACLTDITYDSDNYDMSIEKDDDGEIQKLSIDIPTKMAPDVDEHDEQEENNLIEVDFPEELCSDYDSEDSLDRLVCKYDDPITKPKNVQKIKSPIAQTEIFVKRPENTLNESDGDIIDLSRSPPLSPITTQSPVSSKTGGKFLRKFKSFNGLPQNVAGPSYASSPISKFLDIETNVPKSPITIDADDEFDRLVAKYDFPSPIVPTVPIAGKQKPIVKRKASEKMHLAQKIKPVVTNSIPEVDEDDDVKFISVDDINPMDYKVILLVDICETSGKAKASSDETLRNLRERNVTYDVRKLHVGDFVWIAQNNADKSNELVLPYIVERKRLDDLSNSIKDGRFHEQKFRLKQCGIENVIYLIESHLRTVKAQCGLPITTLQQAAVNTQIHNNFQVKITEDITHTIEYLFVMTSFIENIFKNKKPIKLKMMHFERFNKSAVKQRRCTVRETFIKQLLALKGLSVDIALEITKYYPTPKDLYQNYQRLSTSEGEKLLSKITIGSLERKIPQSVSKTIYHLYMCKRL